MAVRVLRVRHTAAPIPEGCRWCGVERREHVQLWTEGHGWHGWEEPTREQIAARLRAKLAARQTATPEES